MPLTKRAITSRKGLPDEQTEWHIMDGENLIGKTSSEEEADEVVAEGNSDFPAPVGAGKLPRQ